MNEQQTAKVLAKVQLGDNRVVDGLTLREWHDTIGDLDFEDSVEAVRVHRRESTDYLTPAHIVANVRSIAKDRAMRAVDVSSTKVRAPRPANDVELHAAHKSGDPARIATERGIYNRQCVDAGLQPVAEWALP